MAAGITEKQRRFCEEYLVDLNATRAYMAAYPSTKKESTAAVCASQLLRNPKISKYLRKRQQEQQERVQVRQDDVLRAIKEIAFNTEGKDRDRLRALELLGKYVGLFETALDRDEQQARIDKLRREAAAQDGDNEISVNIMGMDADEVMEAIK